MLHFSSPAFLLLLIVLPWLWWHARGARRPFATATVVYRLATVALLVLAAAGLQVRIGEGDLTVIYALDRSASVNRRAQDRQLAQVNAWADGMRGRDRAGVVAFAATSALERGPTERLRITDVASAVAPSATNIARALADARLAAGTGGGSRIVLMSDGCETHGDAVDEAARAAAAGMPIDVVPPEGGRSRDLLRVAAVAGPQLAAIGEPFRISVEVRGRPGGAGTVLVRRDGQRFMREPVVMAADGSGSISFTDSHDTSGLHAYRASVHDELDQAPEERTADPGVVVAVAGVPSVLLVTSRRAFQPLLAAGGFDVTTIAASALPDALDGLTPHDAVVLDDVAPEQLTGPQAATLARYVEESGGGLLVLGGPRSLGAAGYSAGPLGRILPVDLRPRSGRRSPAMALAFVFDKSGSMADIADGVPKIELARAAALRILEVIPPADSAGVIAFDAVPTVVAPMAPAHDSTALAERLRTLTPGGSTAIAPAVELAVEWLRSAAQTIARRHLLLLTDGRTAPADMTRLRGLLRGKGIQLSVVAIGADADRAALEELARSTGGRAFFPSDVRQLPLILAREAARSAGGGTVEERFTPRAQDHPALAGIDGSALPALGGYVVSAVQPGAEPILLSHLDDPVLAAGSAGLGKVAVYTADFGSSWSAPLASWSGSARLWSQTVRWLQRRMDDEALTASLTETATGATLAVESYSADGRFDSTLDVRATVRPPSGPSIDVRLEPTAPGRYEAPLAMDHDGPYAVTIAARGHQPGTGEQRLLRGFHWTAEREQRACSGGAATLRRIAELTGGRLLDGADGPFSGPRTASLRDLSAWLSGAALLLFFLELTTPAIRTLRSRHRTAPGTPDRRAA
jgi:Ca-activated chloride channel family protein